MSNTESDPTAELEDFLAAEFEGRSATTVEEPPPTPPEDQPETVRDAPPEPIPPPSVVPPVAPPETPEEDEQEGDEGEVEEEAEDPNLAWAKRKYGDNPDKWAKAARDMESYIQRLNADKLASDQLAAQWYQYAQEQEQLAQQPPMGMPLSAQEEMFVENSLTDPLGFARQAAFNGRVNLYQGVIGRVAEENPGLAAQIGTQVQMELQQYAQQQAEVQTPPQAQPLQQSLSESFQRLGLDVQRDGPRMSQKLGELGEYHPYVQAILYGDNGQRDLAVQAVYDTSRPVNTRQVQRQQNVKREEELRREAMVVQTGGVAPPPPPSNRTAFDKAMEDEWRRAGAWPYADE